MTPEEQQKVIEKLIRSIEIGYNSSGRMFWRGFLWGLGRGLGATVGLALVLGLSFYVMKATGLDETFGNAIKSLDELSQSIKTLRQ